MSSVRPLKDFVIIDCHAHAWVGEDLAAMRLRVEAEDPAERDSPHNWTPRFDPSLEALMEHERAAGVSRFVLLPTSRRPERCRELSRWAIEKAAEHSEIIPFGSLHPRSTSIDDDVAELKSLGVKGVKLHSLAQRFDPVSPEAMVMYGLIEKTGLPVLFDTMNLAGAVKVKQNLNPTLGLSLETNLETGPKQMLIILEKYPGLRIIAAHMGWLYGWQDMDALYDLDRVYFDLAYVHRLLDVEEAMTIIRRKGADRILFGTDAPYRHPAKALAWFAKLSLTLSEQKQILSGNLIEFLGNAL